MAPKSTWSSRHAHLPTRTPTCLRRPIRTAGTSESTLTHLFPHAYHSTKSTAWAVSRLARTPEDPRLELPWAEAHILILPSPRSNALARSLVLLRTFAKSYRTCLRHPAGIDNMRRLLNAVRFSPCVFPAGLEKVWGAIACAICFTNQRVMAAYHSSMHS